MERRESLSKLFQELGCKVENDAVLDKCFELCDSYNTNMEKFTELWLTFCVNDQKDINPTLNNLLEMEKAILKKDYKFNNDSTMKNMENQEDSMDRVPVETFETDDVLRIYGYNNTVSSKHKRKSLPDRKTEIDADVPPTKIKAKDKATDSFSPAFCVENTSISSQDNVADKENVLVSIGKTVASWKSIGNYTIEVEFDEPHVPSDAKYMYEILSKQGRILTSVCRNLGNKLLKLWSAMTESADDATDIRYVTNVRSVNQMNFRTFGRISTKKESVNMIMLESCTRRKGFPTADSIELDLRNLKQYSVFSGQIVAVEATNPMGDMLYVNEIFVKAYAPPAPAPRIQSKINVFVAAGPFTATNNMSYQPLWDLMEKVVADEPQVLILIGPFIEYVHSLIEDITETYNEFFEKTLTKIMELTSKKTQVILVASNRDIHQEPVFPTPQYTIYNEKLSLNYSNLKLMSDPCILDVEGLKIGVTSVDVIKHMGKEEISNISGMDRLSRLADHLLAQTCFYPVYPPSEELNMDTEMWEKYTFFDQQPHVLILPSDMRCYSKVINNCMIVNPERTYKRAYARLCIKPSFDDKWNVDDISCDIAKI